ncbi:MAG: EVE domain-containing protein [Candidatus Pacebacteria bacterium]|nr:EVE domain-containing protein [Candidatus Paceibacterota bacterium]
MNHWLMKSEPFVYSWEMLVRDRANFWDGVRSHQAAQSLRAMAVDDLSFFYHSNEGLAVVGIMRIVGCWRLDPSDATGKFGGVDIVPYANLMRPVTLRMIKEVPELSQLALVRQSRLSVMPVPHESWEIIINLAGGFTEL